MNRLSLFQKIDSILLAIATFAMCGQVDVRRFGRDTLKEGLGYATKTFGLSFADVVFALLFLWFVGRTVQLKAWRKLWWPPLPCFALIFALVISVLHSHTIAAQIAAQGKPFTKESTAALADLVQWGGYFLVAPWMFVNLMRDRREGTLIRREGIVMGALVAGFVVTGLVALIQSVTFKASAPVGLWSSSNLFAAFVAFLLPFLDEIEIPNPRFKYVPLGLSLFTFGIVWLCVASPFAAVAAWIGLLCAWAARPNAKKLHIARLAVILFAALFFSLTWSLNPQLRPERAEFLRLASAENKVKKQFVEWQVASRWNFPKERAFATGVGVGNYQLNIGPLYQYDSIPNEEHMPPDSNNLYLVQAVSIGILGLGALLWVLWHFSLIAWRAARAGSLLGAGVFGALGAWIFVNFFHAMIVRGAGLLLALFFALAVVAASNASESDKSNKSEL
ncbi:hypothetical protein IAD21_04174 [Abditibacteriota bacterium]|nr:hypothetical protein IAD21_04174 [Abditibacteriota bacterium]